LAQKFPQFIERQREISRLVHLRQAVVYVPAATACMEISTSMKGSPMLHASA
jgi:hypothetical protein